MNQTTEVALSVQNAHKVFGKKNKRTWLSWMNSPKNGAGRGNKKGQNGDHETVAVDHLTFEVGRGEIFGILGPNGGGKSTLIRLIATLLLPDEGDIQVFGHDVIQEPMAAQRMINRVSVEASFFKKLSPMENLFYGARLYGVSGA
jgi:ABC-2 type transport system ATP-binding protein